MSVRLSFEILKKLAAEGSLTSMMPGESTDNWLARIKSESPGEENPPADMSLLSDKEILDAVNQWVALQQYRDSLTDKPIIRRQDSLVLLPGTVSPYMSRAQTDFRVKYPWLKIVPAMHFIHKLLVLRLTVDLGKKDRNVVHGDHIDPRRNKHWKNWSIGCCQYGFPTVHSHNGDSLYPEHLHIREVMRPILATFPPGHGGSDEVVWLSNSDIGLVCLKWHWWQWEGDNPFNLKIQYIPYGPLLTFHGETRILKGDGYNNGPAFEEMPFWMNRVYKEFYATAKTNSHCVSPNPQWDVDVADDQIKDPVIHGDPIKDHRSGWDNLQKRYNATYSAVLRARSFEEGSALWSAFWSLRDTERNIYRK